MTIKREYILHCSSVVVGCRRPTQRPRCEGKKMLDPIPSRDRFRRKNIQSWIPSHREPGSGEKTYNPGPHPREPENPKLNLHNNQLSFVGRWLLAVVGCCCRNPQQKLPAWATKAESSKLVKLNENAWVSSKITRMKPSYENVPTCARSPACSRPFEQ